MSDARGPLTATFKRWEGNSDLPLPAYATAGAAGFDFRAAREFQHRQAAQNAARMV